MDNYNFNDTDAPLSQTKCLGNLPEEVKRLEALQAKALENLGDEKAFLDVVQSESLALDNDDDEYMSDEDIAQLKRRNRRFIEIVAAVALLVGLVVCIAGFKFMTKLLNSKVDTPVEAATVASEESTMLVRSITDKQELIVFDLEVNQCYTVKTNVDTNIIGINGLEMQFKEISPGDILNMNVITANQLATEISYPVDAWTKEGVTGVAVDMLAKSISLTGEGTSVVNSFTYTDDALFLYQEKDLRPALITAADTMTIRGIGNNIWSVVLTNFHGYLTVANGSSIENGSIQIDKEKPLPLPLNSRMPISEGMHTLLIRGSNIEDRTEPVFIISDEETTVNLGTAQSKTGVLIVKVNTSDYKLLVNDAEAITNTPLVLPQGHEYNITVSKPGYKTWTGTINLDQPSVTLTAELTEEKPVGILTISTTPIGAAITLDGSYLGMSPISRQLEIGSHDVSIQLSGYIGYQGTVSLDGASGLVHINLTPQIPAEEMQQRRLNDEKAKQGNLTDRAIESTDN